MLRKAKWRWVLHGGVSQFIPKCPVSESLLQGGPGLVRLRFGGGTVSAVPVFGSGGSSREGVFAVFQFSLTERTVPASVLEKRFRRFRVPRSVPGQTVPTILLLGPPYYLNSSSFQQSSAQESLSCQSLENFRVILASFLRDPYFAPRIPVVLVIAVVSMISAKPALNPLFRDRLICLRRFVFPVVFVKDNRVAKVEIPKTSEDSTCSGLCAATAIPTRLVTAWCYCGRLRLERGLECRQLLNVVAASLVWDCLEWALLAKPPCPSFLFIPGRKDPYWASRQWCLMAPSTGWMLHYLCEGRITRPPHPKPLRRLNRAIVVP